MKTLLLLVLALSLPLAACTSSNASAPANAEPCDPAATAFAKRLSTANGLGMDLTDAKTQPAIDAAKKGLAGTKVAFKNCAFSGQGNDIVSFAPTKDGGNDLDCVMSGGEAGTKKFRHAAMDFDLPKLKLDVAGTVKEVEGRLKIADCSITPHE